MLDPTTAAAVSLRARRMRTAIIIPAAIVEGVLMLGAVGLFAAKVLPLIALIAVLVLVSGAFGVLIFATIMREQRLLNQGEVVMRRIRRPLTESGSMWRVRRYGGDVGFAIFAKMFPVKTAHFADGELSKIGMFFNDEQLVMEGGEAQLVVVPGSETMFWTPVTRVEPG